MHFLVVPSYDCQVPVAIVRRPLLNRGHVVAVVAGMVVVSVVTSVVEALESDRIVGLW